MAPRNGPQSSTPVSAVLTRIHRYLSDLEQGLSDLSTPQNADLTVTAAIGAWTECQRTLSMVLQCVIELSALHGQSPITALDVDAVIQWRMAVRLQLDEASKALALSAQEVSPIS
ncbi:MAG: hypothetical protein HKL85_13680 [Acidimicrobiaceae bacterium]|nr:hypothetical protein [Acidimicrobiaceae bacterium]